MVDIPCISVFHCSDFVYVLLCCIRVQLIRTDSRVFLGTSRLYSLSCRMSLCEQFSSICYFDFCISK